MRNAWGVLLGAWLMTMTCAAEGNGQPLVIVERAPADGLVIARVDLTWAVKAASITVGPPQIGATLVPGGVSVPAQFVPDPDYDPLKRATGVIVLKVSHGGDCNLRLDLEKPVWPSSAAAQETVRTKTAEIRFAAGALAGFPSAFVFTETGKRFEQFVWNDRLYDKELGQFWLRYDPEAKPQVVSQGSLCTVVRIRARYCQADGKPAPSQANAVYDWYVFNDAPLVYVTALVRQRDAFVWNELHFLELNFPDESFRRWAGGEPFKEGTFTASKKGAELGTWGALIDETNALGMLGGEVRYYDGRGEYGTYLHSTTRYGWNAAESRFSTWLWIGAGDDPARAVQTAAQQRQDQALVVVTKQALHDAIAGLKKSGDAQRGEQRAQTLWHASLAQQAEGAGALDTAGEFAAGQSPPGWTLHTAGALGMAVLQEPDGLLVRSLFDLKAGRELLAAKRVPLFTLVLRQPGNETESRLTADTGWRRVALKPAHEGLSLEWSDPSDDRFKGIRAVAEARANARASAWEWTLRVDTGGSGWSVWEVVFPEAAIADLGSDAVVLFPQGPGEEQRGVWNRQYTFHGTYPSGWSSMQFMAAYDRNTTGLYCGMHDPFGSTKAIVCESDPAAHAVRITYEHPAPNMGIANNGFTLSGTAVWQLLRGDWFDAAMIYKAWARKHAQWWPRLTADGRADTPLWMRELCAWAQTGGAPGECVDAVKRFAAYLDVPSGFHWYSWHQIPFDNDYPHYFPTKEGFADGVRDLQQANVFVMPYINGRLWDTRDKGMEDFEFTRLALPAVTKDVHGKPYTETYGSKEQDGSPVKLGVMCPTTALWQQVIKDIVLKLQNEEGVKGVYIDQIAAAAPVLCMDATHGHPLGGGHWWNEGYWKLLEGIRAAKSKDRMLTTECNGEPFIHRMDGYLTWHWQHDGQVPAFPAVYGGAIQMFGRAYGAGATRDLALRMKAAQQLVFGEQIGWCDPKLVAESESGDFFRRAVQLRWRLRRYFYAGEMARPPRLIGDIPKVKADWQWSGEWWVTTDAVLTGAWRIPREHKLVLLFANVSDAAVSLTLKLDGQDYGLGSSMHRVAVISEKEGLAETIEVPGTCERAVTFPARALVAWEFGS